VATEHVIGSARDLAPGSRRVVTHGRLQIGVFNVGGDLHALPNVCIHQFGPVCEGRITGTLTRDRSSGWELRWEREGRILTCPWHSLEYDIVTGQCLAYRNHRLRKFDVKVRDEQVILVM
jgi:nitrite reductase (NADH) small subunit